MLGFLMAIAILASGNEVPSNTDFYEKIVSSRKGESPQIRSSNPHIEPYGAIISAAKWDESTIFVCWLNPSGENRTERDWVREAVTATWQASSALQFKGWGKCAERNSGIRILIQDEGPHVTSLGRLLNEPPHKMVLNFTFKNWSPSCKQARESCIRSIAVHEFGHGIGLVHEQNRPDTPGECMLRAQGSAPDRLLTPFDPDSVMNYCNVRWNNDGSLSRLDREAVQDLYGKPR